MFLGGEEEGEMGGGEELGMRRRGAGRGKGSWKLSFLIHNRQLVMDSA